MVWINCYTEAELHSRNYKREFIDTDQFSEDPFGYCVKILSKFGMKVSSKNTRLKGKINKFTKGNQLPKNEIDYEPNLNLLVVFANDFYSNIFIKSRLSKTKLRNLIDSSRNDYLNYIRPFAQNTIQKNELILYYIDNNNVWKKKSVEITLGDQFIDLTFESEAGIKKLFVYPCNNCAYLELKGISVNNNHQAQFIIKFLPIRTWQSSVY